MSDIQPESDLRRWHRHQVDLPIRVRVLNREDNIEVPGRATELSEGGTLLCAGISLQVGDLLEIEFQSLNYSRIIGVVRSQTGTGYCYGVEFMRPLGTEQGPQ